MQIMRGIFLALLVLLGTGLPAYAQDKLPDAFEGKFRGELAMGWGYLAAEFTVVIKKARGGFTVEWPTRLKATFEPTGRPGVFRAAGKTRVLAGEPVYWARIDDGNLIVYSAQIDEYGGYHIRNYVYSPADGGLDLTVRQVVTGAEPRISKGRLTRYGG